MNRKERYVIWIKREGDMWISRERENERHVIWIETCEYGVRERKGAKDRYREIQREREQVRYRKSQSEIEREQYQMKMSRQYAFDFIWP